MTANNLRILPVTEWPANSEPDGKRYSLESTHNMRLATVKEGTDPEEYAVDLNGSIFFEPVQTPTAAPIEHEEFSGTYAEVSAKANTINALQKRLYGSDRPFTFYPSPIAEAMAA